MMSVKSLRRKYEAEKQARLEYERSFPIIRCWTDRDGVFHTEEMARLVK